MLTQIIVSIILFYFIYLLIRKLNPKRVVKPNGKAVLITGCDSGFGNRLAKKLNRMGFKVFATVLSADSTGAQQLKTDAVFADKMIVWKMDVTNDSEVNEVFERVKRDLQNSDHVLWAVVNNAGINCSCPLEWSTMDTYYKQLEVNLFGVVRITRTFMPLIRLAKGRLTNIVSILGRFSIEVAGIYCMGKHALVAFSDVLRREVRQFNVKVSTIEPAFFRTDIVNTDIWNKQLEQNWNQSTDEVKISYVNYEYQQKIATNLDKMVSVSDNIDAVIDDIIDSIINTRPKTSYRPSVGILSKIQMFIAVYFPTGLFDMLLKLQEKLVIR